MNDNVKAAIRDAIRSMRSERSRPDRDTGIVSRVGRKLYELSHGSNAYLTEEQKQAKKTKKAGPKTTSKKKPMESTRTKAVSRSLENAGMSDKDVGKLKGKR